ncbi:MAG: MFS transporter, partial [Acidimicrobiia bacterium]|nr:MFS transporter [Acidimicrobiia bacterium]
IDQSFGFTPRGVSVSLLVTTLLVGMGVGQLIWGPVSDTYGRIPVLIAGLVLYGIGALGTILAPNVETLLLARFLWGIGAAAPNGLRLAVARDIFSGDQMARVVTFATAVFLVGPVLMPFIGEAILFLGDWELIAAVAIALACGAAGVALWFGETLPRERRRPLSFKQLMVALRLIARTPAAAGAILAAMFYGGAFFIFLGSAQPIIENIYDSGDYFVWLFGLSGVAMSLALFSNGRLITRFGAPKVAWAAAISFVVVNFLGLIATLLSDAGPSLAIWLIWACASNATGAMVAAVCAALALEPMGKIAGTAASILAFAQLGPGAALAAIVDSQIGETVTPMISGALVYSLLGIASLRWSLRSSVH